MTWILLEKARWSGLDGEVLTLGFANEGYARGFRPAAATPRSAGC